MALGIKQLGVLKEFHKKGRVSFETLRRFYNQDQQLSSCLETLRLMGFIKHEGNGVWVLIKKANFNEV